MAELGLARKDEVGADAFFALDPDGTVRLLRPEDGVQPGDPVA